MMFARDSMPMPMTTTTKTTIDTTHPFPGPTRSPGSPRWPLLAALCLLTAPFAGACGGLKLQLVDASVRKPSNVAVYFTVDTTSGQPVANLQPTDFRIYEDGKPIS